MSQATDELRQRMLELFGDPISDEGPMDYLIQMGYVLTPSWDWAAPEHIHSWLEMSLNERDCVDFLFQEWDHGGVTFDALPSNRD